MHDYQYVKQLEKEHQWQEAADVWRSLGRKEDADACQMIADAIAKGNQYRADAEAVCGPEPDSGRHPEKNKEWHEKLREVYNHHYPKS